MVVWLSILWWNATISYQSPIDKATQALGSYGSSEKLLNTRMFPTRLWLKAERKRPIKPCLSLPFLA
jgi:hypothetical protein